MGILKKPILWQNEMVQLIFVIAIGSNENYVFMSSSLIHLLTSNIFAIHELLKIKSLEQLKNHLSIFGFRKKLSKKTVHTVFFTALLCVFYR